MKKLLVIIAIAAGCLGGLSSCTVDGYVETQPGDVVYTRPVSPGADYIWIDGDWVWGGGTYRWHEGHWDHPRSGRTWVAGSWNHGTRGYHWNRGHWN
jgi:hypothetical protein